MKRRTKTKATTRRRSALRIGATVGAAAAAVAAGVPLAAPVGAAGNVQCPHGNNFNSTACNFQLYVPQYEVSSTFSSLALNMSAVEIAYGWHINESIWAYTDFGCGGRGQGAVWAETGLTHGYHGADVYGAYIAYSNAAGYSDYYIGPMSQDGSAHTWDVQSIGGGYLRAHLDGNTEVTVGYMGNFICQGQAGLETSDADSGNNSALFYDNPLKWLDSGGTWHSGWTTNDWNVDNWCSSPPTCLVGAYDSSGYWYNQKP